MTRWTNDAMRPSFLVRSVCRDSGEPSTSAGSLPSDASRFLVDSSLWTGLEPLVLALTLAGYDVPYVVVANPGYEALTHAGGYVTLYCQYGAASYTGDGDWRSLTGASVDSSAWFTYLLRVKVRRTLWQPSPYPPIPLTDVPGYVSKPDDTTIDPWADSNDGWIALSTGSEVQGTASERVQSCEAAVREAVIEALVSAWEGRADGGAIGILGCLDPSGWETALDRAATLQPFTELASAIWAWLSDSSNMADYLRLDTTDASASLSGVAKAAGVDGKVETALAALLVRGASLRPNDANLPGLVIGLEKRNLVLGLMLTHELGLVRILRCYATHVPEIPLIDLTGFYETTGTSSARLLVTSMQLNQAGDVLAGWLYDSELRRSDLTGALDITSYDPDNPDAAEETLRYELTATNEYGQTFVSLLDVPKEDNDSLSLRVKYGSTEYKMCRQTRFARVSPAETLASLGDRAPADYEALTAPLHSNSRRWIHEAINNLYSKINDASQLESALWDTYLEAAEAQLCDQLEDEGGISFSGSTPEETPILIRFRSTASKLLPMMAIPGRIGVSAWDQLSEMLTDPDVDVPKLTNVLGIGEVDRHQYEVTINQLGVALEFATLASGLEMGTFLIDCKVNHLTSCAPSGADPESHGWSASYWGTIPFEVQYATALIPEETITVLVLGDQDPLTTLTLWSQGDFVPSVFVSVGVEFEVLLFLRAGFSFHINTPEYEQLLKSRYAFISAAGIGWGSSLDDSMSFGFGYAATPAVSAGITLGRLIWQHAAADALPTDLSELQELIVNVTAAAEGSFDVDSAELSAESKAAIQSAVARYRALFESSSSMIVIEGNASRTGGPDYNLELSWKRAIAAYSWIRCLLSAPASGKWPTESTALAIPEGRIVLVATGEERALLEGVADGVEGEQWRAVRININNQFVVLA